MHVHPLATKARCARRSGSTAPHWAKLVLVASVLLVLPACSTLRVGRSATGVERSRVEGLQSILSDRAERLDARQRKAVGDVLLVVERQYKLDPLLVMALIEHESRWDAHAISSHSALGLMQVKAPVGEPIAHQLRIDWNGRATLFDPVANVRIGSAYFAEMMDRFGVVELALTAYNIGPNRTAQILAAGDDPPQEFARSVLDRYARIQRGAPPAVIRTAGL